MTNEERDIRRKLKVLQHAEKIRKDTKIPDAAQITNGGFVVVRLPDRQS